MPSPAPPDNDPYDLQRFVANEPFVTALSQYFHGRDDHLTVELLSDSKS